MPLLKELHEWATVEMAKGHGELHVNPVVIVEHLVKERIKNERKKTRIVWETGDPGTYSQFHAERSRYMALAGNNPVISTDLMIIVLKLHPDSELVNFLNALEASTKGREKSIA